MLCVWISVAVSDFLFMRGSHGWKTCGQIFFCHHLFLSFIHQIVELNFIAGQITCVRSSLFFGLGWLLDLRCNRQSRGQRIRRLTGSAPSLPHSSVTQPAPPRARLCPPSPLRPLASPSLPRAAPPLACPHSRRAGSLQQARFSSFSLARPALLASGFSGSRVTSSSRRCFADHANTSLENAGPEDA